MAADDGHTGFAVPTRAWPWPTPAQTAAPDRHSLRVHGARRAGIGLGAAALLHVLGHGRIALIAASLATMILATALVSPNRAYVALTKYLDLFGKSVGRLLTLLTMIPIFYLVFLPFGLLLRRGKSDPMKRFFERESLSYWENRPEDNTTAVCHERPY